jgi:hypothetical protein
LGPAWTERVVVAIFSYRSGARVYRSGRYVEKGWTAAAVKAAVKAMLLRRKQIKSISGHKLDTNISFVFMFEYENNVLRFTEQYLKLCNE